MYIETLYTLIVWRAFVERH